MASSRRTGIPESLLLAFSAWAPFLLSYNTRSPADATPRIPSQM
jgi:hypothetical protein